MNNNYTISEKYDMLSLYIKHNKNASAAQREYGQMYPDRRLPDRKTIKLADTLLNQTGAIINKKRRMVVDGNKEQTILLYFQQQSRNSIRDAVRDLRISYGTIRRTLKKHKYRDYRILPTQKLFPQDSAKRLEFCGILINRYNNDNDIFNKICWTDEASFTTSGIFNRKNAHFWSNQNPHAFQEIQFQGRQSINVWCGVINKKIIGPIFYEGSLHGQKYLDLLENEISNILDALRLPFDVIWQQDGAPPHNIVAVRNYLNAHYPEWIGKSGTITWPPRSPDLTPLDTFVWGHLKNVVYKERNNDLDELQQKIREEIQRVNNDNDIMGNVINNLIKRYTLCSDNGGGHFEQLMF